ncbi:MAG: lipopolysaccharide heptosyltransferase II [Vicinamibacterales bacterium]
MIEEPHVPHRIAIRMPNWLGDAVMALPAAEAVRAAYPDKHIGIAAIPSIAPMFEERTGIAPDQVVTVEIDTEAERLRAGRFDTIILLPNSIRSAWVARQAGIPHRWGFAAGARDLLLERAIARPRAQVHQSQYYAHLVRGLDILVGDAEPAIAATEATRSRAARLLGEVASPLVGFAPGAAYGHAKRWPPHRVAEVIARLVRERSATCVVVGAVGDREAARAVESSLPAGVTMIDLVGRTDLRLLIGVLSHCDAFVSNDSGAMHLAAAAGVPVTAIFGPTKERVTAPVGNHDVLYHKVFCRPCMLRECPIDHRCMTGISSGEVFESVERRLRLSGQRTEA